MENIGEYKPIRLIGSGTFGKVYQAKRQGCEELVALKVVDLKICNEKDREHLKQEEALLQQCEHENLVKFKEAFTTGNNLCIVMELCDLGNLREYIEDNDGLGEVECIYILKQICNGLQYLHNKNIAHRDVKTTNIMLLTEDGKHQTKIAKIGDFGLAKVMDKTKDHTKWVGSPYFMSPEMMNGQPYDKHTDIWSVGCCAYEMATNEFPYGKAESMDTLKYRLNTRPVDGKQIPYCYEMQSFITAMMEKEPKRRPDVQQIITFIVEHVHTDTMRTAGKCRPKTDKLAMTWSPGRLPPDILQQPRHRTTTQLCDTSGYDSGDEQCSGKDEGDIVHVAVLMTEEEKDYTTKASRLQEDISKRINNVGVLSKINKAIESTKHMDNSDVFNVNMKKLLGTSMFDRCECDLMALWIYRRKLLKKTFKIAWDV